MASGFVNLPAFRAPSPLNFSGLNEGIEVLGQGFEKNRLLDQSRQIGSAIQSGDYSGGAAKAFEYGDLDTGLNLANTQRQIEQDQFNRNRLLASDRRAAAAEGRSSELHGLNVQKTQEDLRSSLIARTAGIAQTIRNEKDPQRKAALVQSFVNAHPKLKTQLDAYNFDPANPDPTLDMIIAEAQGLTTPAKDQYEFTKYGVGNKTTGELQPYPQGAGVEGPPNNYRWRMRDGQIELDATGRPIAEPIPGSSAETVSAETAARVGLSDKFLKDAPAIREEIKKGGLGTTFGYETDLGLNLDFLFGTRGAGELYRRFEDGSEALVRNLTGAGMNKEEAESYAKRYLPGYTDTRETVLLKLDNLEKNLQAVINRVETGRGRAGIDAGTPPPPPQTGGANSGRLRYNPETGELE